MSQPAAKRQKQGARIGPVSIFALLIMICMAVLAVLSLSTANASLVMSQRLGEATDELYLAESSAQAFLADLDDELGEVRDRNGSAETAMSIVRTALLPIRDDAQAVGGGQVEVTAAVSGNTITAEFACQGGRVLSLVVTIREDASYRIDKWKVTAVQNEEQPAGTLWVGA